MNGRSDGDRIMTGGARVRSMHLPRPLRADVRNGLLLAPQGPASERIIRRAAACAAILAFPLLVPIGWLPLYSLPPKAKVGRLKVSPQARPGVPVALVLIDSLPRRAWLPPWPGCQLL